MDKALYRVVLLSVIAACAVMAFLVTRAWTAPLIQADQPLQVNFYRPFAER